MHDAVRTHSLFGPSSLERRQLCPGSYHMEKGQPDLGGPDADRGRLLHGVVEQCIKATKSEDPAQIKAAQAAVAALNEFDQAAVGFCLMHFEMALAQYRAAGGSVWVITEQQLALTYVPEIEKGTLDLGFVLPNKAGHILDFKFGQKPVTHASENIQLASYAIGFAAKYNLDTVRVSIVQPFLNIVTEHVHTKPQLLGAVEKHRDIVAAALKPDAPLVPGAKQCDFCKAAGVCKALAAKSAALPIVRPAGQLTHDEIAKLLPNLPLVKKWIEQVEERALADVQAGATIPGYTLGEGRRTRQWTDEYAAEKALAAAATGLGKDPAAIVRRALASPAQIEAAWGKAKPVQELLEPLITHKPGNPKLVKALPAPAAQPQLETKG